jgi:hypothetical protein
VLLALGTAAAASGAVPKPRVARIAVDPLQPGAPGQRSGLLPAITQSSTPPGPSMTASDPVVAHDSAHGRWLVAGLATSVTGGKRWRRAWTSSPMRLTWLADTSQGRMVGDYLGLTFTCGRALAVVVLARRPAGARLSEALYAVSALPR